MDEKQYNLNDLGESLKVGNIKDIWEEVKANQKKLSDCPGSHEFVEEGKGVRHMYRCSKCGGTIDSVNYFWYLEGLKHGIRKQFPVIEEDPDIEDPEPTI